MRVEQALKLVCLRLPLRPHGAGRPGHGEVVSARPAGARGRRGVGGGTVATVFSNGPEPRRTALQLELEWTCGGRVFQWSRGSHPEGLPPYCDSP